MVRCVCLEGLRRNNTDNGVISGWAEDFFLEVEWIIELGEKMLLADFI